MLCNPLAWVMPIHFICLFTNANLRGYSSALLFRGDSHSCLFLSQIRSPVWNDYILYVVQLCDVVRSCFDPVLATSTGVLLHLVVRPHSFWENAVRWETPICIGAVGKPNTICHTLLCRNSTSVTEQLCADSISRVGIASIIIIVLALGLFSQKRAGVSFLEGLTAVSGYCSTCLQTGGHGSCVYLHARPEV